MFKMTKFAIFVASFEIYPSMLLSIQSVWLTLLMLKILMNVSSVYVPHKWDITPPKTEGNRTAIILSGQLRSGNLTWDSGKIGYDKARRMFGGDDPPSPIDTVMEWLIKPYALHGGVDMFIYIQVDLKFKNDSLPPWDGDPATYEHRIGDFRMCELYSKDPIFLPHTGNKVFCITEYEKQVTNQFIEAFPCWRGQLAKEILLQQLYGIYRANMAAKQYSLATGVKYRYKIRLRPDLAVVKPFPPIYTINFANLSPSCVGTIYYPNNVIFPQGAEDSFNIGETEQMDHLLDRYVDLTTKPFIYRSWRGHPFWAAESWLQAIMEERYKICFTTYNDIWMVVIRKIDHHTHYAKDPVPGDNIWTLMKTDNASLSR